MTMPGRSYTSSEGDYRYGFNGKEKDDETYGTGNEYDYGFRMYDPRVARFNSVDPFVHIYPGLSGYQYATDRPIDGVDWNGLEWKPVIVDGKALGFEWAGPDEAFDENGKLRTGYFEAAIVIIDYGTWDIGTYSESKDRYESYNLGSAVAIVYGSDGPDDITFSYKATTRPSDPTKFATIQEGLYQAVHTSHKGKYPALQVRKFEERSNYKIPTIGDNPAHPDRDYAEGINIHKAGKNTPGKGYYTGTFWSDGRYSGVSEGCLLIDNSKWDSFMNHFDNINNIALLIIRTQVNFPLKSGLNGEAASDNTSVGKKPRPNPEFKKNKTVERAPGLGGKNKIEGGY